MTVKITITADLRSESMYLPTRTLDGTPLSDETILALARVACTDLFYIARGDLDRDAEYRADPTPPGDDVRYSRHKGYHPGLVG